MTNWDSSRDDGHRASPGTLDLTLRTHASGGIVPAVWDDQGRCYDGSGASQSFKSQKRARRHGKKLLRRASRDRGVRREVVESVVIDIKKYEAHVTEGE